jgi:hypothetical protein
MWCASHVPQTAVVLITCKCNVSCRMLPFQISVIKSHSAPSLVQARRRAGYAVCLCYPWYVDTILTPYTRAHHGTVINTYSAAEQCGDDSLVVNSVLMPVQCICGMGCIVVNMCLAVLLSWRVCARIWPRMVVMHVCWRFGYVHRSAQRSLVTSTRHKQCSYVFVF